MKEIWRERTTGSEPLRGPVSPGAEVQRESRSAEAVAASRDLRRVEIAVEPLSISNRKKGELQ